HVSQPVRQPSSSTRGQTAWFSDPVWAPGPSHPRARRTSRFRTPLRRRRTPSRASRTRSQRSSAARYQRGSGGPAWASALRLGFIEIDDTSLAGLGPLGHLGQLDPGGISPEVFQIVVIAGYFIHHVDDDRPVVHQNPPGLLAPLPAEGVLPGSGDLLLDRLHDGAHVGGCLGTGDDKVIGQDGLLSQVQDEDINGLLLLRRLSRQEGDLLSPQLPTPPRPISQGISPRSRSAGSMAQSSGKSFPSTSLREPPSPRMGTSWGRIGSSWASASASSPHPGGTSIWVWGMPKRAAFPT